MGDELDAVRTIVGVGLCLTGVVSIGTLTYFLAIRPAQELTRFRREQEHARWQEKWGINAPGIPVPGHGKERK